MKILFWHMHGGWADSFVRGEHEYLLPATAARDPFGIGRAGRDWPARAREVSPEELAETDVDVAVLQRLEEFELAEQWLGGRTPGRDLPTIFVEHNTPKGNVPQTLHPLAGRSDLTIVHVTHFNSLMWDTAGTPTTVVEHGVVDPGHKYTGELPRFGAVINEPVRRARVSGSDLLAAFTPILPVDVFGMGGEYLPDLFSPHEVAAAGDLPTGELHNELAKRRAYLHTTRWTSLGLSLLEAMHLGMPVLTLGTTEAYRAVPPEAGAISTNIDELVSEAGRLAEDPDEARRRGEVAREYALQHYGLAAFLHRWNTVLGDLASPPPRRTLPLNERNPQ